MVEPMSYELHLPELGLRRPVRSILACPKRLYVAWHRDAKGIYELLDACGHNKNGHPPQDRLWEVREYERQDALNYDGGAYYEVAR